MNNKPYTSNIKTSSGDLHTSNYEEEVILKIDKIPTQAQSVVSECHESSLNIIYGCADDFIYILKRHHISSQEFKDICDIIKDKLYDHC